MTAGSGSLLVDYEVEVALSIRTTREDVEAALTRSGLVVGAVVGEAMVDSIQVYSPEGDDA